MTADLSERRVAIVGDSFGYPNGYGATARVHAYAKCLMANGIDVHILCLKTSERAESGIANALPEGRFDGVPFVYTCGTTLRSGSFWGRRWLEVKGALGLLFNVLATSKRPNTILIYSASFYWITWIWLVAKTAGASCVLDVSEFPYVYRHKTTWIKFEGWVYIHLAYQLMDGFIVISKFLEVFVTKYKRHNAKVLRAPVLVEVEKFPADSDKPCSPKRIVYSGNLNHEGEVIELIDVFRQVVRNYPDVVLQILGSASNPCAQACLRNYVEQHGLQSQVEWPGWVKRADVPKYLMAADVLVLFRSQGLFSQAGFPTKLGEYLATARPVVVTNVGEISLYLQSGANAYLVDAGDKDGFASQILYVLLHPDEANIVGRRGRETAMVQFSVEAQGSRITSFVGSIMRTL